MDLDAFLRSIPKAELHCHVTGSVRPTTFAELARKNGISLPPGDPERLYEYDDLEQFLTVYGLVSRSVMQRDDFARIAFESLEDGVRLGNLRYREMFFNPSLHMKDGIPYADVVDGLVDGIRWAESELGVRCRLIANIYRQDSVDDARHMLEEVLSHRPDEVIGMGMDGDEMLDPPEKFSEVYREAGKRGLRLTAHAAHDGPPSFVATCLDILGCERVDHGYHVIDDPAVSARMRDDNVPFTCALGCPPLCGWPKEIARSPIKRMVELGLRVTLGSDDPPMLHTDIGNEYVRFCLELGFDHAKAKEVCLAAVDASWLDESERRELRDEFEREIDGLERQVVVRTPAE